MPNRHNTCRARPPRFRAVRQGAHWLGLAATGLLAVGPAGANPQGGQVTAGTATIGNSSPLQLDITQSTNRAVIDWQSFNIAVGERTQFHQPSSGSWTLNRVNSPDPSTIAGYLGANGGLVLVNPAGVVFSKGSQVNVNSLIATPAGISNANFMAGNMRFDQPGSPNARIVNDGTITVARKGLAALVAPSVANSGVIRAKLGKVVLAGAETFTLDFYGDGLINFDIGAQVASAPVVGGRQVASLVSNTGLIDAPGGTVLLTADAVAGVLENVIDSSGRIDARTMAGAPGKVTIDAGAGNQARLDGTIDVSASQAGQQGGTAIVTGGAVHLTNNARIYAQGPAGGGTVKIGGGPHGTDTSVRNAQTTTIDPGAVIDASALDTGNGGTIAVWSDGATTFNGAIYAKGGPNGGNGGWIETSGKATLNVGDTAIVDTSAPHGAAGSWLLDPNSNVDITNATSNVTCTGTPLVCSPNADSSTLNAATIIGSLNGGTSVTVNTLNAGGTQPGNITVDSSVSWTTATTLTLNAAGSIVINAAINGSNAGSVLALNATGGSITQSTGVLTAGTLNLTAGTDIGPLQTQVSNLAAAAGLAGAGNITIANGVTTPVTLSLSGALQATNAGGGAITLTNNGTISVNSPITATGAVNVTTNGATADIDTGSGNTITSNTGGVFVTAGEDINLGNGVGNGSVSAATGIILAAGRDITLDANATVSNSTSGNLIATAGGNITMATSPGSLANAPEFVNQAPTGSVSLTSGSQQTLTLASTGTNAVASNNGNITLAADSMVINQGVNAGTARVALEPATAGEAINLGTGNSAFVLGLTQAELNQVTAGVLQIGSATASNMQIIAPITNPAGWSVLTLINNGVIVEQPAGSLTVPDLRVSSTGPVTLTNSANTIGVIAADTTNAVSITSGATILTVGTVDGDAGIVTSNAPITLTADGMSLAQQVNAVTATVTLQPLNSGTHTALGVASSAGTLGLTDASLGEITASLLQIGNSSDNAISISGAVTRHAGYSTLALTTGSLIDQTAPLSVANLALRAGQGINLTNPGNDVDTLAFTNGTSGGVFYTDSNGLTIGPVNGLTPSSNASNNNVQITTIAGDLFLNDSIMNSAGGVILSSGGSVTENGTSIINALFLNGGSATGATLTDNNLIGTLGPWSNSTSGNLSFVDAQPLKTSGTISNSASTGTITLTEIATAGNSLTVQGNITSTNGIIALQADAMSLQAPVNSGTARTILEPVTFNQPIDLGTNPSTGKLGLANSDLNEVTAGVLQIGSIGAGDITVTAAIFPSSNVLTLVTNGSVTEVSGGSIGATDLSISAAGAVTLNSTINNIQVFAADSTSSVSLTDAVPLTIGTVDGNVGITSNGPISLTGSFNTQLTVSQPLNSTNSDISLTFDAMSLGAAVNAGTGIVTLQPFNSAVQTSLGVASTSGVLGITDAGLANITAGLLQVGDTGFADSIVEIGGPVTRHAGYNTLSLTAGFSISQTAPLSVANLALRSNGTGGITLTNTGNDVDTLAFNNTSGAVSFNNGPNPLTIGSVDGLTSSSNTGTTTTIIAGGNLNLNASVSSTGTLTLTSTGGSIDENGTSIITAPTLTGGSATGALLTDANLVGTLDQFTNTTSGNLFFTNAQSLATAGNVANSAPSGSLTLTVNNSGTLTVGGNVSTVNGSLTLAADAMSINAAITSGAAATQLEPTTSGQAIDLGTKPGGVLGLTQGDLNEVSAGVLRIGDIAAGNITLTAPVATPLGANVLTLITNGNISEQAGASLTAPDLRVAASGPVTLDQAGNAIQVLAVDSTSSVTVVNSSNLTIGTVDGTVGIASTGAIALSSSAANTQLTVNQALDSGGAGDITLTFDQMSLAAAVNAGTGIAQLTPFSPGLAVDVGTKPGGVLGLLQTDLNNVTAGVLRIGDLSTTGDLTVTAPITNPAGWNTLSLLTSVAGGISQNAGATLTVPNLNADGATGVSLTQSGNTVKTLAGASLGSFSFVNSGNLTIGSVDPGLEGAAGIFTGNGPIGLASAGSNTNLTVSQPIDTTLLGTAAGANITLTFDQMSLGAAVNGGTGGIVTLQPFSAIPIALGVASSPSALALTDASLGEVTGSVLQIGNSGDGSITVGGAITRHAGYDTLSLTTGSSITQSAPLSVANLALRTGAGITLTNAGNDADTLAFNNTSAAVSYTDSNALAIGSVNGLTSSSNTGTTTSITAGGNLDLNANLSSTGNLTLTTTSGGNLTLGGNLTASGQTVTLSSAGAITQSGGIIRVATLTGASAGNAGFGQNNAVTDLGGFTTGNGNLTLNDGIGLGITGAVNTGSGTMTLTVGGAIVELADGSISAANLATQSSGGASLGGSNNIANLMASTNSGAGGFSLNDMTALTVAGPVNAGTGDLALTTGALTVNGGLQAGGNLMATASGPIGVNGSLTFNAGKNLVLSSNGALTQTSTLTVASPDVVIDTTGRAGGAAQLLSDLLAAQGGGSSISSAGIINAPQFAPKDSTHNAISLATGTVDAPNSVLLLLGDGGAMTGTVNVLGLGVSGTGGSADLHGSIAGNSTQAAAQLGFIDPQPQNNYLFNGCAIGSATCTVVSTQPPGQPVVGPVQPPVQPELPPSSLFSLVDTLVARPSQDDFDVPLVGTLFDEPICRKLRRIDPEAARQVCQ